MNNVNSFSVSFLSPYAYSDYIYGYDILRLLNVIIKVEAYIVYVCFLKFIF